MRGLAEYAMSGRRQAATVVVLFGLIPMLNLLSGAVVALVGLRKGPQEGFLVMMWALLPAGLQWLVGDTTPVIMIVGVAVLAYVLRRTQSWQQVLLFATLLGLLLQMSLPLQTGYIANVRELLDAVVEQNGGSLFVAAEGMTLEEAKEEVLDFWLSLYGIEHMLAFIACLMIGRYWQAMLYNPGGFRQEFHNLRIDPRIMAVLLALMLAGLFGLPPLDDWMLVFGVIPGLCGLAVAHYAVAARKLGTGWLVATYVLAMMAPPILPVLGFADSLANIRRRMAQKDAGQ